MKKFQLAKALNRFLILSKILFFFEFIIIFIGCGTVDEKKSKIESIHVSISIDRFDIKFHRSDAQAIPKLKASYPYLFPAEFDDNVWAKRQKDSLQLLIQEAVENHFKDLSEIEKGLSSVFQHILYYFPEIEPPHVIGLTNNVDYQIKTVYADSLLLLSLDTFLGSNHPLYEGIPNYIRKEMDKKYLTAQVVDKFAAPQIRGPQDRTFLAQIIWQGKKLYLQDLLNPNVSDAIKIGYLSEELQWAQDNERLIWQYFIEKQLLYDTNPDLTRRFITPAPFSKFYLEIDNESPGRIGPWIGWQMVRSYMDRYPKTPLKKMLQMPPQELFQASGYKPKR